MRHILDDEIPTKFTLSAVHFPIQTIGVVFIKWDGLHRKQNAASPSRKIHDQCAREIVQKLAQVFTSWQGHLRINIKCSIRTEFIWDATAFFQKEGLPSVWNKSTHWWYCSLALNHRYVALFQQSMLIHSKAVGCYNFHSLWKLDVGSGWVGSPSHWRH